MHISLVLGAQTVVLGVVAFAALAGCTGSDTQFTTRFASDFTPARHAVSILGVYQDGRVSTEAWDALAPRLTPALGASRCELGYNALVTMNDGRTDAIDEFVRGDREPGEVLAQVSPAAKGDLVLLLHVDGTLPERERAMARLAGAPPSSLPSSLGRRTSGRMGGMPGHGTLGMTSALEGVGDVVPLDPSVLTVSASFFSVQERRLVATVSMEYSGSSLDDASARFAAKIVRALPEVTCAGWNVEPPEDAALVAP